MTPRQWTEEEKARLRQNALDYVIPYFASNKNLARGPKIFTYEEGCGGVSA